MARHLSFRSGNPALNKNTFDLLDPITNTNNVMTLGGAVNKTAISMGILMLAGYYTYTNDLTQFVWPGFIGGFVVALITIFKKVKST